MRRYRLSSTSEERLNTCHKDLQLIIKESLAHSFVDLGVAQGERSIEQQQQYYNEGKSQVNPKAYASIGDLLQKGKHIVDGRIRKKSMAVDIYAYYNGSAQWDVEHLCYLAGVITATAKRLKEECRITHDIRWGGNWSNDGVLIIDQNFVDLPHYELI